MDEKLKYYVLELLNIKQQLNDLAGYAADNFERGICDIDSIIAAGGPLSDELENIGVDIDEYFMGGGLYVKGQKIITYKEG
jgi:hypothetical protein